MTDVAAPRTVRGVVASPRFLAFVRAAVGAGILVAILVDVGGEPFLRGIGAVSVPTAAAAVALGAAATVASAWRWRILAGRLGLPLAWRDAVPAYYRSMFLNSVLPGGVIGDVDRALSHGRDVGRVAQASRAVVAERAAGQAVQLVLVLVLLVSLRMWAYAPAVGIVLLAVAVACAGLAVAGLLSARARAAILREVGSLRIAFGSVGALVKVTAASAIVVVCLVAMFFTASVAVGVDAPPERLVALALVAVLAGAIPLNIGGWGPREGVAAWAFAAAGLGAAAGIAASTAFGVLALIAVAPGAIVIAASALHRRRVESQPREPAAP